MATLPQLDEHAQVVGWLTTAATADLVDVWRTFELSDVPAVQANLPELLNALVGDYGPMAMTIAGDWYDTLREFAGARESYSADVVDLPPAERLQALSGWSTEPLTRQEPDTELALSRVSGGLQRVLADIDRDMVETNGDRDPTDVRFARHASATACAFCILLATRGPVYRTEDTARFVTGARGSQPIGSRYHDHCRCIAVPVWPDDMYEEAPYVERWRDAYFDATDEPGDLKAILARMRKSLGVR